LGIGEDLGTTQAARQGVDASRVFSGIGSQAPTRSRDNDAHQQFPILSFFVDIVAILEQHYALPLP
jgi:hypothetical protein